VVPCHTAGALIVTENFNVDIVTGNIVNYYHGDIATDSRKRTAYTILETILTVARRGHSTHTRCVEQNRKAKNENTIPNAAPVQVQIARRGGDTDVFL